MANILFIADFFADQIPGGGELNNKVLIEKLYKRGHTVRRVNSHLVNHMDLLYNENIIVSNFVNLSEENKKIYKIETISFMNTITSIFLAGTQAFTQSIMHLKNILSIDNFIQMRRPFYVKASFMRI